MRKFEKVIELETWNSIVRCYLLLIEFVSWIWFCNFLSLFYLFFQNAKSCGGKSCQYPNKLFAGMWGGKKEMAWLSWDKVCLPGLGIKNIVIFNDALLVQWKWHIFHERKTLWSEGLKSKYRGRKKFYSAEVNKTLSSWWKYLCKVWGEENVTKWFDNMVDWK